MGGRGARTLFCLPKLRVGGARGRRAALVVRQQRLRRADVGIAEQRVAQVGEVKKVGYASPIRFHVVQAARRVEWLHFD
jgi:hypothetical protein